MTVLEQRMAIFIAINVLMVVLRRPLAAASVASDRALRKMNSSQFDNLPLPTYENAVWFFFWGGIINAGVSTLAFPAIRLLQLDLHLKSV
jgi:hypothetical protein